MISDLLHPLSIETADRYARFVFGLLKLKTNRPMTLRHLNTLAGYEQQYLTQLHLLRDKGKHYFALAALSDAELEALDLDFEIAHQTAPVEELNQWEHSILSVILGEAADESLIGLESRVAAIYWVG